jgi:hypothetical protein
LATESQVLWFTYNDHKGKEGGKTKLKMRERESIKFRYTEKSIPKANGRSKQPKPK